MKGKIKIFQKCVAFRPSVLGMRTRSLEGVVTPTEIFQIGDHKKVKYIVIYWNVPNLDNICKWPFFDKLSDTNVQITL